MSTRCTLTVTAALATFCLPARGQTTAFTYQGQLKNNGALVSPSADVQFTLWDQATLGTQIIGSAGTPPGTSAANNVPVAGGLFTTTVNALGEFGPNAFNGAPRWLAISVRSPAGSGSFVPLSPRQPLTPTPYALSVPGPLGISGNFSGVGAMSGTNGFAGGGPAAGFGVRGVSTATSGGGQGGYFESASQDGRGLTGRASATSGNTFGIVGQADSSSGAGVFGLASATGGVNYGVRGESDSAAGYGGYFVGRGYFSDRVGIGTAAPTEMLQVFGGNVMANEYKGGNGAARFISNLGDGTGGLQLANIGSVDVIIDSDNNDTTRTFRVMGNGPDRSTATVFLVVNEFGNVGIGTAAPQAALHVRKAGQDGIIRVDGGAFNNQGFIRYTEPGQYLSLSLGAPTNDHLVITANGQVGIGTTTPESQLHVYNRSTIGDPAALISNATLGIGVPPPTSVARLQLRGSAKQDLFPPFEGHASLRVEATLGTRKAALNAEDADMPITFETQGSERMRIASDGTRIRPNSNTNLLISNPDTVNNDDVGLDFIKNTNTTPSARIEFCGFGDQNFHQAELDFFTRLSTNAGLIRHMALTADGKLQMFHPNGTQRIEITANEPTYGAGEIDVRYGPSVNGVRISGRTPVAGTDRGGGIDVNLGSGVNSIEMRAGFDGGSTDAWMALKDNGSERITLAARNGNTGVGGLIDVKNASGVPTVRLKGDTGGGFGEVQTSVLNITGGSDLSEQFDISGDTIEPGMLVVIDPDRPGRLAVSRRAYDPTVAGIISGAGGVRTGMTMGQVGTAVDGKHPVALSGRVYCWCDAGGGAINPGDMLTTSDTPGHAMKVANPARTGGAVIGKAMSRLADGRGLVLVLVSLQ